MERIDSHQHFWKYDPVQHGWMNKEMGALKRDFGPEDLSPLLRACNLDGCVAVQATQTEGENSFLLGLAAESSLIKGIIGWVDLQSDSVAERLAYYKNFDKMKGFRHVIHDEPDSRFMLRPRFMNGIKELAKFNFTYDILIFWGHLEATLAFVKALPDQPFVIDHIAKPDIKGGELANWKKGLAAVAGFPNVYCKISGMVTEGDWHHWRREDFTKYMDVVVELFGTDRIMYGSDWPVCTLAAPYKDMYTIVADYFSPFSKEEQDRFFGLNAKRFYNL